MQIEKLSISKIVEFRRLNEGPRRTLINNLTKPKAPKQDNSNDGGGDYWQTSISAISNAYRNDDSTQITEKISEAEYKREKYGAKNTKDMFQQNIGVLHNFENFDFKSLKPNFELEYILKPKSKSIFKIGDIPIQVLPQHVFTYRESGRHKIGSIWFVAKINGYKEEELSIFTDALYRYLDLNYSNNFFIDTNFCTSVDVSSVHFIPYANIENKQIKSPLDQTLDLIRPLL